jgi:hypothetical protein
MKSIIYCPQSRFVHVRVNLRRRQIRMTQHELDGPKIRAAIEQVRRKRMSEDMWAQRCSETRLARVSFEDFPEAHAGERSPTAGIHK